MFTINIKSRVPSLVGRSTSFPHNPNVWFPHKNSWPRYEPIETKKVIVWMDHFSFWTCRVLILLRVVRVEGFDTLINYSTCHGYPTSGSFARQYCFVNSFSRIIANSFHSCKERPNPPNPGISFFGFPQSVSLECLSCCDGNLLAKSKKHSTFPVLWLMMNKLGYM